MKRSPPLPLTARRQQDDLDVTRSEHATDTGLRQHTGSKATESVAEAHCGQQSQAW